MVDYTAGGASPLAQITDMLRSGLNGAGLRWDGQGITSAAARDNASGTTTLGVIDNIDPDGAGPLLPRVASPFAGQAIDDTCMLVRYTYFGDVNFDGVVDAADYALIDNGFNFQGVDPNLRNWANGDMNFDGVIDAADYALIDNAFNFQSGALTVLPVPEPTAGATLALLAVAALARRQGRRAR
jgi:hypothetical protein